jgi:hypothetical protein
MLKKKSYLKKSLEWNFVSEEEESGSCVPALTKISYYQYKVQSKCPSLDALIQIPIQRMMIMMIVVDDSIMGKAPYP